MTDLNVTTGNAILKELYDAQKVRMMSFKDAPLFAMLAKKTDFGGKNYPIPLQFGTTQGRSAKFANAQANATAPSYAEFLLTRVPDYSTATISGELMLAATGDRASFITGTKNLVDSAIISEKNSIASGLYRSGTGSVAQVNASGWTAGVATLTNQLDNVQFENGMTLNAAATDGATPRAALGYVIAVNRGAGTITVSTTPGGSAGTPSGWSANDFLVVDGDSNAKISGVSAWLPQTAPSGADNFFGVNRSVDSRLYGVFYDGSGQIIEEALIDGLAAVHAQGGNPDVIFTNTTSYAALAKSLQTRAIAITTDVEVKDDEGGTVGMVSFKGLEVATGKGTVRLHSDIWCPAKTAYALQMDTWTLASAGACPHIVGLDGSEGEGEILLRQSNADSSEVRVRTYFQLGCGAPGWNGVLKLGV
ncbi:MAG: hypothetical protein EPO08_21390 [Rhodospirillaceae bacterium]|nr:MAG: hypothetical protein EPO08_21390 [Rhodospirillaceae bacterium]